MMLEGVAMMNKLETAEELLTYAVQQEELAHNEVDPHLKALCLHNSEWALKVATRLELESQP